MTTRVAIIGCPQARWGTGGEAWLLLDSYNAGTGVCTYKFAPGYGGTTLTRTEMQLGYFDIDAGGGGDVTPVVNELVKMGDGGLMFAMIACALIAFVVGYRWAVRVGDV